MPDYNQLEAQEAKRDGATLTKNSGRGKFSAGDAKLYDFSVDYKFAAKSFTFNATVWAKVCSDAAKNRMAPALKLIVGEQNPIRVWLVEDQIFHDYIRLRQLEDSGEL